MNTYSAHAEICAKFYDLTVDAPAVSRFAFEKSRSLSGQNALFVGGMFEVASELARAGLKLTVCDYTDEMVEVGRNKLHG